MQLRIHRFIARTEVEGPGVRACLWVQGCPHRCHGCAVPLTWPAEQGELVDVEEFAQQILSGPQVEGITFVGGEPFEQAAALAALGKLLRRKGLSIVTFTGYLLEDIKQSERADWKELLAVTDLLIDGPYKQEQSDLSRPWVGSANQRYFFLTDRYKHLEGELQHIPNKVEIRLEEDGTISVNGMADMAKLEDLLKGDFN